MLKLVMRVNGQDQVFETASNVVTFGRAAENMIQVTDPKSSRLHCRLEETPQGWKLVDLESSNGTAVNGQLVNACVLKPGDRFAIGAFEVVFNPPTPAAAPGTPAKRPASSPALPKVHVGAAPAAQRSAVESVRREQAAVMGFVKVAAIAAVLLVGGVFGVNYMFGSGKADEQRASLRAAQEMAAKGDLDLAAKAIENLMSGPIDSTVHREAKKALEDIRGKIAVRDEKLKKDREAKLAAEEASRRAGELVRLFDETTASADSLVAQEQYGAALDVWKRFQLEAPEGEIRDKSAARVREILSKAEADWAGIEERANRLSKNEEYEQAAALISSSMAKFQGTRFYYEAQDKISAIQRLSGVTAAYAAAATRYSPKTQEVLLAVGDLVRARRYGDALKELDRILPSASPEEKAGLDARRTEIAAQAGLFDKLIAAVNQGAFGAHPIDLGNGAKATLAKATNESLEIAFKDEEGKGGTSSKRWHQIDAVDILGYFAVIDLSLDDQLTLASFCFSNGLVEEGSELLAKLIKRDASREKAAFELIARHRGMAAPRDGFVWYDGGWYTKAELEFAKLELDAKKAAGFVAQIDSKKAAAGMDVYRRVMADPAAAADLKARVQQQFVSALKGRRAAILRKLNDSKGVASAAVMRDLKRELNRRRAEAIKVIYDKEIYPEENHGKAGQPRVDEAVGRVRELWDNPLQVVGKLATGISDLIASADQTDAWLKELGAAPSSNEQAEIAKLLSNVNEALSLKNFCLDGGERSALEKYRAIMAYNDRHPFFEGNEKDCIRATNEYRFMMGRQALEAHGLLGKAARGHSADMAAKGFFDHTSPVPGKKSPADRCRAAGYPGGGIGENIAMGMTGGRDAMMAWYNSSGHHRNMLSDLYNQIGIGNSGSHWTENLGRGGSEMGKEKTAAADKEKTANQTGATGGGDVTGGGNGGSAAGRTSRRGGVSGGGTVGGGATGGGTTGGSTGGGGGC